MSVEQRPEMKQRVGVARLELGEAPEAALSLLCPPGLAQHQPEVVQRRRVIRRKLEGAPVAGDRRLGVAGRLLRIAEILERFRFQLQGA